MFRTRTSDLLDHSSALKTNRNRTSFLVTELLEKLPESGYDWLEVVFR